jgi:hypothetical protein
LARLARRLQTADDAETDEVEDAGEDDRAAERIQQLEVFLQRINARRPDR